MEEFNRLKSYLEEILDNPTYQKWAEQIFLIGCNNNLLFVGVPNNDTLTWFKSNLLERINTHFRKNCGFTVRFVSCAEEDEYQVETRPVTKKKFDSNLQKKYTFDSFVQSDSNRIAYSFAYSVSEFPGKSYNPLYIFSDVGLGKTHLLHAIGNRIQATNKSLNSIYLTTSDFMNEYVEFTRMNKRPEFIKKYTSIDVLLIDDIQYITRWGGTSEQFYYIFNSLIQQEKQIVICSDKHPDNIPDLENRIRSRFEMGGIADILPYDLETRIAILKKKIRERKKFIKSDFIIPDEVLYFLASTFNNNIRSLEGSLNRLLGFADLKFSDKRESELSLAFAKEALKPLIDIAKKSVSIDTIQEFIAEKYSLKVSDLKTKNNSPKIALPRQIGMYIAKRLTKSSLNEIGFRFGGKHHTTVLHAIGKVEKMMESDSDFSRKVDSYVSFFSD